MLSIVCHVNESLAKRINWSRDYETVLSLSTPWPCSNSMLKPRFYTVLILTEVTKLSEYDIVLRIEHGTSKS